MRTAISSLTIIPPVAVTGGRKRRYVDHRKYIGYNSTTKNLYQRHLDNLSTSIRARRVSKHKTFVQFINHGQSFEEESSIAGFDISGDVATKLETYFGNDKFKQTKNVLNVYATPKSGHALRRKGFVNVDAVVLSDSSELRALSSKAFDNVFRGELLHDDLHIIGNDTLYDAVVSSGVFYRRCVEETQFDSIIDLLKPGGLAVVAVSPMSGGKSTVGAIGKLVQDKKIEVWEEGLPMTSDGLSQEWGLWADSWPTWVLYKSE